MSLSRGCGRVRTLFPSHDTDDTEQKLLQAKINKKQLEKKILDKR